MNRLLMVAGGLTIALVCVCSVLLVLGIVVVSSGKPRYNRVIAATTATAATLTVTPTAKVVTPSVAASVTPTSLPMKPNPLNVTVKVDEGRSTKARMSEEGGIMTATGADGTVFTLTIPPYALYREEEITMKPVVAMEGLPLSGGLGAAVDLSPEGLFFLQPATLTIKLRNPIPIKEEISFAYRGTGQEFHLYPILLDPSQVAFSVSHFTGYGIGRGTDADEAAQQSRAPSSLEYQYKQRIHYLFRKQRQAVEQGKPLSPDLHDNFNALFKGYFRDVVSPLLTAAETDDSLFLKAFSTYWNWKRLGEMMMAGQGENWSGLESLTKGLLNAFDKAYNRCTDGDLTQFRHLVWLAKTVRLLGLDINADELLNKAISCLPNLEMVFDSTIEVTMFQAYQQTAHLRAVVPLQPDPEILGYVGEAPLEYVSYDLHMYDESLCQLRLDSSAAETFKVFSLTVRGSGEQGPPGVELYYDPGLTTEKASISCPSAAFKQEFNIGSYSTLFYELHKDEKASTLLLPRATNVMRDWAAGEGVVLARKTYNRSVALPGGHTVKETTTVELRRKSGQ